MKKQILPALLSLIVCMVVKAEGWNAVNTGHDFRLRSIEFPGGQSLIGFAGGQNTNQGIILKTIDGGSSWSQEWLATNYMIEDLCFLNLNIGYACGWNGYVAKTTDGGANWVVLNPAASFPGLNIFYYTSIAFKDASNGVVAGLSNLGVRIFYTNDGGATWALGSGLATLPYKVVYKSENTYFLVTANGAGNIQKSTDGGQNWTTVYSTTGIPLFALDFLNPMVGMAGGENGWIYKTFDGGVSWQSQQIDGGISSIHDFAWADLNNVFACGTSGKIYLSTNGGVSWINDYPTGNSSNDIHEIIYSTNGTGYSCGSGGWFYKKIPVSAIFSQDITRVCNGNSVHFYDQSIGSPTSWFWTFEGGNPATSTAQNPVVTYQIPGIYDVSLTVSNSYSTNSKSVSDLINVESVLTVAPTQPSGPNLVCGSFTYPYSTSAVAGANSYSWVVEPVNAGIISGSGLTASFTSSNNWNGNYTVKVAGVNSCGTGPYSALLNCTLYNQPTAYPFKPGGGYCSSQAGFEIKLQDSDLGASYQLYKNGTATGTPIPGTGDELSFGIHPMGTYTASATNGPCTSNMVGFIIVYPIEIPLPGTQPIGPISVCSGNQNEYTASLPQNAASLVWVISPATAGSMQQTSLTTLKVTWNPAYSGIAELSVQGLNECGTGTVSIPLQVSVNALPTPVITGPNMVCLNAVSEYETNANQGSSYNWTVTGGQITSGNGSSKVKVNWNTAGIGTLKVDETSAENCVGTSTVFDVAVDPCVGIIEKTKSRILTIYPNPVSSHMNIKLAENAGENFQLRLIDPTGREILRTSVKKGVDLIERIDTSGISSGYYLLQLLDDNTIISQIKVIKL